METPSSSSPSSSSSPATAGSPPDKYNVRWTTHHAETWSAFSSLLASGRFVDVVLSCRNRTFRAHKVVLSACSPYLRDLLDADVVTGGGHGGSAGGHPILILQDATPEAVEHVIEFMYTGNVDIPSRCLADFIKLAECFQVRGIKGDPETRPSSSSSPSKVVKPDHGLPSPPSSTHDEDGDRSPKRRVSTASSNDFVFHHPQTHQQHPGRKPAHHPQTAPAGYFRGPAYYGQAGQHHNNHAQNQHQGGFLSSRLHEDEPLVTIEKVYLPNGKTSPSETGNDGGEQDERRPRRNVDGEEEPCDFSMGKPRDYDVEDGAGVDDDDDDDEDAGRRENYVLVNDGDDEEEEEDGDDGAAAEQRRNGKKRRLPRHFDRQPEEGDVGDDRWDPWTRRKQRGHLHPNGRQLVPVEVTMAGGDDEDNEHPADDGVGEEIEDEAAAGSRGTSASVAAMRVKNERNPPALLPYQQGDTGRPLNIPADVSPESPLFKVSNSDTIWVGKTYNNWTMYFCSLCPYQSRIKSHLWRHSVKHTGQKPFVCALCLKAFSRRDNLKQHMNYKHPGYDLEPKRECAVSKQQGAMMTTVIQGV